MKTKLKFIPARMALALLGMFPAASARGKTRSPALALASYSSPTTSPTAIRPRRPSRSSTTSAIFSAPARPTSGRCRRSPSRQWQRGQASFGAGNGGQSPRFVSYDDRLGILTPNATTPYYIVFVDLCDWTVRNRHASRRARWIERWLADGHCRNTDAVGASISCSVRDRRRRRTWRAIEVRRSTDLQLCSGLRITGHRSEGGARAARAIPVPILTRSAAIRRRRRSSGRGRRHGAACRRAAWSIGNGSTT